MEKKLTTDHGGVHQKDAQNVQKSHKQTKMPTGEIKYKNGTVVAINPNVPQGMNLNDPNQPGMAKPIASSFDQFFGTYISETKRLKTFSEWANKYYTEEDNGEDK